MEIQVLLLEDIDNLGYFGDVVEVAPGYARNYLVPYGLATIPSNDNLRAIADEKARRAEERIQEQKRQQAAADKVDGAEVVIAARANEQGHLFGSVTERDIAENLRGQGFQVADEVVKLGGHVKEIGSQSVKLRFAPDIEASVELTVVPEGVENEESPEQKSDQASEEVEQAESEQQAQ